VCRILDVNATSKIIDATMVERLLVQTPSTNVDEKEKDKDKDKDKDKGSKKRNGKSSASPSAPSQSDPLVSLIGKAVEAEVQIVKEHYIGLTLPQHNQVRTWLFSCLDMKRYMQGYAYLHLYTLNDLGPVYIHIHSDLSMHILF
jgi:hypothetical protein